MRPSRLLLLSALLVAACNDGTSALPTDENGKSGPQLGGGSCNIATWQAASDPLSVTANSANNDAGWFIKNNGTSPVTLTGESFSQDGAIVTATRTTTWALFPHTLGVGQQLDADVLYDVAGPGTGGSVGLSVTTGGCGTVVFPAYTVNAN